MNDKADIRDSNNLILKYGEIGYSTTDEYECVWYWQGRFSLTVVRRSDFKAIKRTGSIYDKDDK